MIAKKSKQADLEKKRFAFFQIGLIVSGSLTLVAFEYSSAEVSPKHVQLDNPFENGLMMETVYEPDEIDRPEPKDQDNKTNIQMVPVDEVIISSAPVKSVFTNVPGNYIPVNDPCDDCYTIGDIYEETDIVIVPDIEPSFPGGLKAMYDFISGNIVYPEFEKEAGVEGVASVQFVVNTDGSIVQVETVSNVNKNLAKEAERVIKMMPNWIPGEQAGKKVRVRFVVPISFVIKKN